MSVKGWMRSLRAALLAMGAVLAASWIGAQIAKIMEAPTGDSARLFDKLLSNLAVITLLVLPVLYLVLRLKLLERIHRLRRKLFAVALLGQGAAFVTAVVTANNGHAMAFHAPYDGLFAVLLVYAATLSLALAALLASSIMASLSRIQATAARIANGDLEARVIVDMRDELGELASGINTMAMRLAEVAQRERRVEQSRRELVAAVSHDLRTPLAALQATIEAITDGVVTDEETIVRYLRTMHAGTRELSRLIDDLFQLSRIEAGALTLVLEPMGLADVVSETLERMGPHAEACHVTLSGSAAPDLPLIPLDVRYIGRVLVNLVDNALRHTPEHGQVDVSAHREGAVVRIDVADTGHGIDPEDLPRVFERFYRGDKSRSRESGGAGLGLAISKGFVEAHGGAIWAEAREPHGARLSFTLPVKAATDRQPGEYDISAPSSGISRNRPPDDRTRTEL